MSCPKCGAERAEFAAECGSCGIVFSKWSDAGPRRRGGAPLDDELAVRDGSIGRSELMILVPGLIAAIVVYAIPLLRLLVRYLVTLFHELGHAIAGWILGHPSIPAFDFVYGGGLTSRGEFRVSIAVVIAGGFAYLGWIFRRNRRTLIAIGALFLVWLLFVSAEWRRDLIVSSAGHLSELILAGIFFYMALAGVGFKMPEVERPLAAFAAFFVTIHSIMFARNLRNDPDLLELYRQGKGGMLMNDLESVALDFKIHLGAVNVEIGTVAGWLIAFSVVPFAVALLWYFNRARCHAIVRSLLEVQ